MKILYALLFMALLFPLGQDLSAQPFRRALGVRLGYPVSVSYKQFVSPKNAFELYAGGRGYRSYRGLSLNAAYQIHEDITGIRGLQFYYGAGVGVHFWTYDRYERGSTTTSVSGYLGLQYLFPDIPINLTLDWVPTLFFGTHRTDNFRNFGGDYGGLGIRYAF